MYTLVAHMLSQNDPHGYIHVAHMLSQNDPNGYLHVAHMLSQNDPHTAIYSKQETHLQTLPVGLEDGRFQICVSVYIYTIQYIKITLLKATIHFHILNYIAMSTFCLFAPL